MFRITYPRSLAILICTLILVSSAHAAPRLNGVSVHQELGNEQFIGALYAEALSDNPDSLINSNLPMRMELKVVAPSGIPTRRFSRMWIEGMAINNSNSLLTAQADNMVKFDGFFKGTLAERDHIVFALNPGSGVDISINNVLLGNIPDDEFFGMLLRTWVGRVPLSSGYRSDLLKMGNVSADLRGRFEALTFDPARVSVITGWTKPAEPVQVAAAPRPEPRTEPAPRPAAEAPPIAAPRLELPPLPADPEPVASTEAPAPAPAPAQTTPEPVQEPLPQIALPRAEPTPAVADEEEAPVLTAQSLLARQFYVSDILRKIHSNVRYPRISEERGQEGSMRIAITVDRNGNIVDMSWLEESRHDRLNKEAWDAVRRSAPFPAMPTALPGQQFELTAPIAFKIQR